jgi:phosphoglycerate dehydrogenase-like enzyme
MIALAFNFPAFLGAQRAKACGMRVLGYNRKMAALPPGVDTFAAEPLPADHPLWDAPNTIITPHTTPQVPDRTGRSLDIICENIKRWKSGEPLLNLLEKKDVFTKG